MKRLFFTITILLIIAFFAGGSWYLSKFKANPKTESLPAPNSALFLKLQSKAVEASSYASQHKMNSEICFMIDMSIESGSNRFFVYHLKKDSLLMAGLVTHGRCNQDWLSGRKYGNEVGCGCSSLGKYKIGVSYQGRFGLAYKLHGLESTNSNAYKRFVVLHSHSCVPSQ